jgi:hypothetical protein
MGVTIISNVCAILLFIERDVTRFQPINVSKLYTKMIIYIPCMLVREIYSPKSIIFPESNAQGEYDTRG